MKKWAAVALVTLSCSGDPARPPPNPRAPAVAKREPLREASAPRTEAGAATADAGSAVLEADRRELGAAIVALANAGAATDRTTATRLLARLRGAAVHAELERLSRDDSVEVRRAAARAWGQQTDAPTVAERHLLAVAASDPDAAARAHAIRGLSRVASEVSEPALRTALAAPDPALRAAACHAIGLRATTGAPPTTRLRIALAEAALTPTNPDVATECAFALARSGSDEGSRDAITASVTALLRFDDADARSLACRAAGQLPAIPIEMLLVLIDDPELRVRIAAARAAAARAAGNPTAQRTALAAAYRGLQVSTHPLLALLEALEGHADTRLLPDLQRIGRELTARARREGEHADRALGVVHCALARVVDRLSGRPGTVPHCGLRLLDAATVASHHAEILGALEDVPAFVRGDALLRLHRQGNARVRVAVLTAATAIDDPRLADLAIEALGGRDPGLIAAAADLVTAHPERFRGADGNPRPDVGRALAHALTIDHVEARISVLHAIERVADPGLGEAIGPFVVSPNEEIRRAAAAAYRAIRRRDPPAGTPTPVVDRVTEAMLAASASATALEIETTRGAIRLALEPDAAPTTVARIVSLADRGFYDGLAFHRVVPGFVAQGGDPRGDGYGGPEWDQRCEDRPDRPYVRGTVGMALAGRDTGGSQFFVTYGRQPHLDGGYTPFAHVEVGMDVLDRIVPGDVMTRVRVVRR